MSETQNDPPEPKVTPPAPNSPPANSLGNGGNFTASDEVRKPARKRPPRRRKPKPATDSDAPQSHNESGNREANAGNEDSGQNSSGENVGQGGQGGDESNRDNQQGNGQGGDRGGEGQRRGKGGRQRNRRNRGNRNEHREKEREREAAILEAAPAVELSGLIEISPKGFGFLRQKEKNYLQSPEDVFITPEIVRIHGLRDGLWVKCQSKVGVRGPQLVEVLEINGREPEAYHNLPYFEELTAINPTKRLNLETKSDRYTTRVIDLMTPIGRGQRGLIVAPPRTGKTTLLHHIADAILEKYEEEHVIVMLIDERPEEVTDFQRSFPQADIFASSNDSDIKNHTRMALLAIERAKRLVEAGENVFILLDSITRMARAFNNSIGGGKKRGTQSGGIAVGALEIPRKLFAAARNTREAGALTIIATALIDTNSRMDEAIFQEFKGTGNLEIVLDRHLSQNYIYPAIDIHKSGTRREELLLPGHQLDKIHVIRRGLAGYKPMEAMQWLLSAMGKYPNNAQMLMDIKTSAVA